MKKAQRLLCLLTTLILLLAQLPALADGYVPLTQQEIAQARQLIAMEGDIQGWEKGMTPSASMNALQIQQYLEWLLSDEVGGLLVRIRDKAELLGNQSLEGVEDLLRQFRDHLDHYRDRLETGRLTVFNSLHQLEADAELTQREKRRLTDKVREYVAEMQTIIGTVVRYYQQYEEAVDSHELNFLNVLQAADTPDGAITQQAEEKLLAEAEALTNEEQAHIDGRNSVDFSVVTLSTKQFGFIIRDHEGKLLKDAQVSVQATGYPRSLKTVTTGENGLASFLVADFVPTSNRRVTLDVVVTHSQHNTREMRRLTLRGGQAEIVRLEKYTGVPYLRMACYNGSDIVVQQNTIYYTAKNDAQQTIDVMLENPGKQVLTGTLYLVYQTYDEDGSLKETEESRKLTTGEAVTFTGEYCRLIVPGSTVSIRAEIPSKSYNRTFQTQLKIEKAYVEEPVFNNDQFISFTPGGLSFQFPADTPFVGDLQMNLSLPFIQSQMVIDPSGYIQYAYGKTFESEELSWKQESLKDKTERMDEAAREGERDANAVNNQVYQNQGASKPAKFLGNIKAMLTPFAALQGRITEVTTSEGLKEKVGLKGNAGVQMAFKGGYTYPFMIWAIPCFCAMDFTFSLGTAFSIGLTADWPSMSNMALDFGTGVTIAILAELGVSGGVGVKDLFSLAVRFYGNIKPLLRLGKSSGASVTLGFGLEVTAQMILLKLKRTLWKGSWSSSSNGTSALNAANGAENGDASLTALSAGVNIPEKKQLPPAGTGKTGVFPTSEEQLFKQTDALAQEIQYVTLQSGSEKATFGLWITPTGQATGRQAKLIWYNLDDSSRHGEIYPSMGGDAQRGPSGTASDYAFAIRSHQDMVAVNVLSGVFTEGQDHPSKSTMTLAVLQLQNGSLVMKKYAPHVTETPNAARYLSSPIVYFVRHNNATAAAEPVWFLNASCAREDIKSGEITAVHSMDLDQTSAVYAVTYDPTPDGIENVQGVRRMTSATPTNATFTGEYITGSNGSNPSLSCYYWLNEKQQLSVHLNKTKRVLDEHVVFMENMVEYAVNDAREFVFYLKEGFAEDGSECYRLMGATRQGNKEFTVRDYDVCLYAQRFQTAHVNDGSRYGIHYLYWTESIAPDPDNADQEERYRVKCVRFDRETNTMSAPFTLVELSHYPASIHLLPDGTGYYTTDLEQAQTLNESAVNSRRLIRFEFELKIAAELTGVASSDPCVTAGESAGLLFSVENKGNLPISRFGVTIKQGSKVVQQILVDCQNPQNSVNSLFASNGPSYSVTRLENVYDDMNGDRWLVTTTGDNGQMVEEALHTDLLMPGGVHTYEAAIEIPDDWDGTVSLTAELEAVYAMTQYASLMQGSAVTQANAAGDTALYEVCALPTGEVTGYAVTNAPGQIGVGRANALPEDTSKEIGVGQGDLMLDCQPYVDADDEEYVRVSIVGRSQTDSTIAPTLTATMDGKIVFSHTFMRAIDRDFGYTLDLPAELLLAGKDSGDVTFLLTDNEEGNEFSDFDNERTVSLGNELRFLKQPESLSRTEGEEAVFSVALAGGRQPYAYRWQRMDPNGKWTDIPGATQAEYRIAAVQAKDNGALFRCIVQDQDGCSLTSEAASLAVFSLPPTTGDSAQPVLWALLLLVCAAGWLLCRRKKA